jgi:Zn-dependent protease with chaperone function
MLNKINNTVEKVVEKVSPVKDFEVTIQTIDRNTYFKHFSSLFALQEQKDLPAAVVKKIKGEFVIVVNDAFMAEDKEVQNAIFAHEIGHIKCGHLDNPNPLNIFMRMAGADSAIQMELEADKVAIDNGHERGLKKVLDKIEKFQVIAGRIGQKETSARKRQLK